MRNLSKHPVSIGEIVKCLDDMADEIVLEQILGDMRPLLLREASKIVTRAGFAVHEVKVS